MKPFSETTQNQQNYWGGHFGAVVMLFIMMYILEVVHISFEFVVET